MLNDSCLGIERLALVTTVMWMALLVFSPGTPAAESPVIFPLPQEIEEAAQMDGMGFLRIFTTIVVPLSWPGFVATGLIVFIFSWNE